MLLFQDWDATAARRALERDVSLNPSDVYAHTWLGIYHAVRGDAERAGWLITLGVEPLWDPLRSDPRFQALAERVGVLGPP